MNLPANHHDLESLLEFIKQSRGFDFSGYKRTTLSRRIQKRMDLIPVKEYREYIDYLQVYPNEFAHLFNAILINVTSFFRDPNAWEFLSRSVIPGLIERKHAGEALRVWSAGCATGQETYTIAMLLAEAIGPERFRQQVKIYSTDLDEDALNYARMGSYTNSEAESVPEHLREKYFESNGGRCFFNKDLRRSIIFGRHDLTQDAPISRIDLLICRNVLMYFNSEMQARILARLNYAMLPDGLLFLGKAEMLLPHLSLFTPVDLRYRIFRKTSISLSRETILSIPARAQETSDENAEQPSRLVHEAFEMAPMAHVALDARGVVTLINARAREMFHLASSDIGRPFQDLEISYRPVELRSSIETAQFNRGPVTVKEAVWQQGGEPRYLTIQIQPLNDATVSLGVLISFQEVTEQKLLQTKLEQTNAGLEDALEELQSTNEELETTNEELQSTIEELETTNEELQSTNEELETMNEELQSTNEELETMNDQIGSRSEELEGIKSFMESVFIALQVGVIAVDRNLKVRSWNRNSEEMWGVRADEAIGRSLESLDIGLPIDLLRRPLEQVMSGERSLASEQVEATNRRGKRLPCAVTLTPVKSKVNLIEGVTLVIEPRV